MTAPPVALGQAVQVDTDDSQLPPLKETMGERYPAPNDPPEHKVAFARHLIATTNPIAFTLSKQAARNAHYAAGKTRISWSTAKREWREDPLEEGEHAISVNHIRPILRSRTQRLLSSPVDFSIIPDSNALEQRDRAEVGVNFLQARYRLGRMHETMDTALEYAYYGGCAALKSFWNKSVGPLNDAVLRVPAQEIVTGPDGLPVMDPETGEPAQQPAVDPATGEPITEDRPVVVEEGTGAIRFAEEGEAPARYRLGDTDTALRTVFQIRLNPEATGWRPADGLRYLLDIDEVPVSVAKRRFPALAQKIGKGGEAKPNAATERAANTALVRDPMTDVGASMGLSTSGNAIAGEKEPTVLLVEYWELEGPYFPRGRLIQLVGDQQAYDGEFPDGVFPYDPVFDEPAPGWAYGRPSVNDMVTPADIINRQWTAADQEMQDSGVGQYVSLDVPGVPDQLDRTPRRVIKIPLREALRGKGLDSVFKRMEAAQVPPDRWRMIELAQRALFDIGSFHEVTRGQVPPGVDSGVAVQKLLEQEQGQLQKASNALKETLISWARKQLHIARKYYGEVERWIPVQRPDLGFMVEGVTGIDLPDPDKVVIELENFKPRSEAAFKADIKELMTAQIIPPAEGLRLLDLGRGVEGTFASQTRHYAKARQENLWIERGEATLEVMGEQPIMDPMTGQPLADPISGVPTGDMEPVQRIMAPAPDPEPDPETGEPALMPLLLPEEDDHAIHLLVLQEIILDVTKPWAVRQLAIAHASEHRQYLAPPPMAAPAEAA